MLKRIKVEGYKSLVKLEVELKPLTVLFGPNAAGKSNFLDALQLISRLATCRTIKDAFEAPYRGTPLESFTFGPAGIEDILQHESAQFTIEVDVELSPAVIALVNRQIRDMKQPTDNGDNGSAKPKQSSFIKERYLRYRITVEILPKIGVLRVADEYLAALNHDGEPTGRRKPFIDRPEDRLLLRMEGQAHPTGYDRYLDYSIISTPLYMPHHPHVVAMRYELASWYFFYFEPRERMRAASPVKEIRHIGMMGENLASFLNTLKALDPKTFKAVQSALHMLVPNITEIDVTINNLGEVELRLREDNRLIPARVVSEGTLRMLGLLALGGVKDPTALLGFEEPENGIHPQRIELVAELLKTRARIGDTQLIVTTHSPTLLKLIPEESLYNCQKNDGITTIRPLNLGGLWKDHDVSSALNTDYCDLTIAEQVMWGILNA